MGCGVGKGWMTLWKICVGQVRSSGFSSSDSASSHGSRTGGVQPYTSHCWEL